MSKRAKRKQSARSLQAKKGWATRRKREAAEFRRRSKSSKKGWRRRKAKARIKEQAKVKPKRKGKLAEFIVIWTYHGSTTRTVDFMVIARSTTDAELFVVKAVAKGEDSKGLDLTWMAGVPWDETDSYQLEDDESEKLSSKELRALGENYVEVR